MTNPSLYPRPALTVDCVVFGLDQQGLQVLLIQRDVPPFAGEWALPGGFVRLDESLDAAARRELSEETGVRIEYLEQLYTFGAVDRDPRERVVTVAYYALVKLASHAPVAATDARAAQWFPIGSTPKVAFDHEQILTAALERLRGKLRRKPVGFDLLPPRFSLRQLQQLYEQVLGRELDKRNFRKKILGMDLLVETDERESGVAHRAARLYRFDVKKYQRLCLQGFHFEV
ncbi:NUDIX hydrolase [Lignipirellula cremea]|uniref:Bifunctional NMN adenylyltransferase/Nudix hydrolase n=1 Tax=Lignipirellula cremea TaxID=2528010 RepID=A0A518DQZ5_9BACT|nr:NUDIX domain-containing protein [Lignipirellula cremea]QDU94249.1 Bifunctional NMN adenylyltransferase/Nudix hydrolase [Lignipirellula cremea]